MTDRKQARAMDLPNYPCPPTVGEIATHAGSWGWAQPFHVAQDDDGYLWAKRSAKPTPRPEIPSEVKALLAWTEEGVALWIGPKGYALMKRIEGAVDGAEWIPVASVFKELPGFARTFEP